MYLALLKGYVFTCECLLAACDDNRANVLVIIVLAQGIVEFREQRAGEGVQCLWAVQCDCNGC